MVALNSPEPLRQKFATTGKTRAITHRTSGSKNGPITRLMSPGDLGEQLKPFVFLDLFSMAASAQGGGFAMHPHSGIATLSFMIEGQARYVESTGRQGVLSKGAVEWMKAGKGAWHSGGPVPGSPAHGFQLWLALPPGQELAPAQSLYLTPSAIPQVGPVRVLLGRYGGAQSVIPSPAPMNFLAVQLQEGEHWRYDVPGGHTIAWAAVSGGQLDAGELVNAGELVVFDESDRAIEFVATKETTFVLGSAVKHPHDLVLGYYSVHTNQAALERAGAEIRRIGLELKQQGQQA